MTKEQTRILGVWEEVENRAPNKSLEMIARMTAEEANVGYIDVMEALSALLCPLKTGSFESEIIR